MWSKEAITSSCKNHQCKTTKGRLPHSKIITEERLPTKLLSSILTNSSNLPIPQPKSQTTQSHSISSNTQTQQLRNPMELKKLYRNLHTILRLVTKMRTTLSRLIWIIMFVTWCMFQALRQQRRKSNTKHLRWLMNSLMTTISSIRRRQVTIIVPQQPNSKKPQAHNSKLKQTTPTKL